MCCQKGLRGKVRVPLSRETLLMSCRRSRLSFESLSPHVILRPFFICILAFSIVDESPGTL